jgi:hypothetical protein
MITYKNSSTTRYAGPTELSQSLNVITKPIFRKRGLSENKLISDWNVIVGIEYGNRSTPKKISFYRQSKDNGTLYIETYDSGVALELEYMKEIVLEKIARYFGYKAIAKIVITQRPGGQINLKAKKDKISRNISENKKEQLHQILDDIEDPQLKEALSNLGMNVMSDM